LDFKPVRKERFDIRYFATILQVRPREHTTSLYWMESLTIAKATKSENIGLKQGKALANLTPFTLIDLIAEG